QFTVGAVTPDFFRVYVDADQNPATGFPAAAGVGADFLLEDGAAWRSGGTGWSWSSLGALTFDFTSQVARWTVSRSRIGVAAPCGQRAVLAFQTQDHDGTLHTIGPVAQVFTDGPSCGAPPPPPPP